MAYDPIAWAQNDLDRQQRRRAGMRWALVFGVAMLWILPVVEMIDPGDPDALFPPGFFFSVIPLMLATQRSPFARDSLRFHRASTWIPDEFEHAALGQASHRALGVALMLLLAFFGWMTAAAHAGWPVPSLPRQWFALGMAMILTIAMLPALIAEWTIPLPPAAQDAEDDE